MSELTIITALKVLGYPNGWVVNNYGVVLWDRPEPQPTDAELVAAGWIKPELIAEEATEE